MTRFRGIRIHEQARAAVLDDTPVIAQHVDVDMVDLGSVDGHEPQDRPLEWVVPIPAMGFNRQPASVDLVIDARQTAAQRQQAQFKFIRGVDA
ncbi:MAG: hypothetical protein HY360_19260 [Verrucomicrobia bacterium]|nr:hypothetical protein [Verrucomicrobiota bacterium]